ncbi:hypothetical protein GIB67_035182 [Kingdonia uniflora]|uniref:SWIM-type domain-containing protein n=1 Tax=Kingdonia uniflora TaxID=39325 RepID=A0A7J7LDQ6_9MAGN|nr:hypothetical protein GIB67_035182 [Kingdonia uniflora]
MGFCKMILVFVLLMESSTSSLGFIFGKKHVRIINGLKNNAPLTIHCLSFDDDLGVHILQPMEYFSWSFRESLFSTTYFHCSIEQGQGKKKSMHFSVYNSLATNNIRRQKCNSRCWWFVRGDGIFSLDEHFNDWDFEYGVAYTNHVDSWNNIILKVRDLPIHVFIEKLRRICSKMSYLYREEAEKSQARVTSWATDHCESRKFVADSLTCRVSTSRYHFQMTSYGRTDYVNIEDGTCSCRWWQTMGIPCKCGVRTLDLANVDPTTRVFEYFTNDTYKAIYEPIWIPIREIERWKILKTDPHVRAPIPTVRAAHPRIQRKRREKMSGLVTKLRFCSRCRKNGYNRRSCKLLPIPSDDNTRPTMAPSFTMSTKPSIIPDEDVAISLH